MNNDIAGLQEVLREPDISQEQLNATVGAFCLAIYGQKKTDSLNTVRYRMYMSRKKPRPLKKLPLTDSNLQLHVIRAHLQSMLWKAVDQGHPPVNARDFRRFGWGVKESGVVTPSASDAPVASHGLLDIVSCSCSAERKACSETRCSCHRARLSCTEYCYCERTMRAAVPSISIQRRINWLKTCRKTTDRLTMMNNLFLDELLVNVLIFAIVGTSTC